MAKDGNGKKEKKGSAFLIADELREIEITQNGKVGIFKYRDIGAFEHHKLITRCGRYDPTTGQLSMDFAAYIHEFLKAVLVEAPFELTDENLKLMRPAIATKLMNSIGTGIKVEDVGGHSCA